MEFQKNGRVKPCRDFIGLEPLASFVVNNIKEETGTASQCTYKPTEGKMASAIVVYKINFTVYKGIYHGVTT